MPSSSEEVHTTVFSSPVLRPLSAAMRLVFARLPWWMLRGKSMSQTLNLLASTSDVDLVLVNMRVVLCPSMRSLITLSLAATSGRVNTLEASS